MSDPNQAALDALIQAVRLAPDNVDLADHLGRTLLRLSRFDQAADVYRQALAHHPGNVTLQLGLADSYRRSNRISHALAIVETLVGEKHPPAEALLPDSGAANPRGSPLPKVFSRSE